MKYIYWENLVIFVQHLVFEVNIYTPVIIIRTNSKNSVRSEHSFLSPLPKKKKIVYYI